MPPAAENKPGPALWVSLPAFQGLWPDLSLEGIVLAGDSPNESFVSQAQLLDWFWQIWKWNHFRVQRPAPFNSYPA